jgi:arylsulfatase A-like enzyme/Tfp pilus assembly protein PilF
MRGAPLAALLLLAAAGGLAAPGCNRIDLSAAPDVARPSVLLVSIDTLRADHVGVYGAASAETPRLDALAAAGARFATAIAPAPLTLPSHASLLTALDPPRHGVRHNGVYHLEAGIETLAERFQSAGYATGAVVGAVVLARRYGLDQGFESYDDGTSSRRSGAGGFLERSAAEVTDRALGWLESAPRPFFLWVHYYDPHHDYRPPPPFAERFASSPYDGEVAYVDSQLGRLLDALERGESRRKTLILVTSDHGESLGEHGESTHAYTLYDGVLRVPLILAGPGVTPGRVVETLVRTVDVAPTLLALSGLPALAGADGEPLTAFLSDGPPPPARIAYAETLATRIEQGWSPLFAVRSERHLFVRAPRPELYDVSADPAQLENLLEGDPARVPAEAEELARSLEERTAGREQPGPLALDRESLDEVRALGYAIPSARVAESGLDPKDGLRFLSALLSGVEAYDAGDFAGAIVRLERVLEFLPSSAVAHSYLAHAHLSLRRPEQALPHIEAAVRLAPESAYYQAVLGDTHRQLGNGGAAAAAYQRAVEIDPSEPLAQVGMQWMCAKRGDLERAAAHASRAAEGDPRSAHTRVQIGLVWDEVAEPKLALRAYREAVRLDPEMGFARMLLAIALAREGRIAESERERQLAGALSEDAPLATRLAAATLRGGDAARAERLLRDLLRAHPDYAPARRELARLQAKSERTEPASETEEAL